MRGTTSKNRSDHSKREEGKGCEQKEAKLAREGWVQGRLEGRGQEAAQVVLGES